MASVLESGVGGEVEKGMRYSLDEPVGGSRDGHGLSSDRKGVDLRCNDPCKAPPGGGEEGDEEADEGDENPLSGQVRRCDRDSDGGNDDLSL
jgi:hypothetical protein